VPHHLWVPVIGVACCQAECQDLPTVIDRQVQLEAIEPPRGAFPPFGNALKNFVLLDPVAVTYVQGCRVHKADARAFTLAQAYKKGHGQCCIGHEFYKTVIAYQMWEEASVLP